MQQLTPHQARQALMVARAVVGAATWLAPRRTGRLFGIDPEDNPAAPFLGRLYAARNLALAAILAEGDDAERDRWLAYGIVVDAATIVAALAGGLRGYLPKRAALMLGLTAGAEVALGVIARRD